MLKRLLLVFCWIASTLLLFLPIACSPTQSPAGSTSTVSAPGKVSFKNDIQPIFTSNCVVCHQGGSPPGSLSLEPAVAYRNLVRAPSSESQQMRIVPGSVDQSYLLNKLQGTQSQAGGKGTQMPYNAPPLPQAKIDLIRQWILEGAMNN